MCGAPPRLAYAKHNDNSTLLNYGRHVAGAWPSYAAFLQRTLIQVHPAGASCASCIFIEELSDRVNVSALAGTHLSATAAHVNPVKQLSAETQSEAVDEVVVASGDNQADSDVKQSIDGKTAAQPASQASNIHPAAGPVAEVSLSNCAAAAVKVLDGIVCNATPSLTPASTGQQPAADIAGAVSCSTFPAIHHGDTQPPTTVSVSVAAPVSIALPIIEHAAAFQVAKSVDEQSNALTTVGPQSTRTAGLTAQVSTANAAKQHNSAAEDFTGASTHEWKASKQVMLKA